MAGGEIYLTLWGNYFDKSEIQKRIRGEISIHRFTNTKTQTGNNFIVPLNLHVDWSYPDDPIRFLAAEGRLKPSNIKNIHINILFPVTNRFEFI